MGIKKLKTKFLRSSVNVYRKSMSVSDIGDFAEIEDNLVYSAIPAAVRPKTSDAIFERDGVEHFQTHQGFLNKEHGGETINLALDDIFEDTETGMKHTVIGIQDFYPANALLEDVHHIEVALESTGNTSDRLKLSAETISSKVRVA